MAKTNNKNVCASREDFEAPCAAANLAHVYKSQRWFNCVCKAYNAHYRSSTEKRAYIQMKYPGREISIC